MGCSNIDQRHRLGLREYIRSQWLALCLLHSFHDCELSFVWASIVHLGIRQIYHIALEKVMFWLFEITQTKSSTCCQVTLLVLLSGALRSLFIIFPFIAFQTYGYYNMCVGGTSDEMRPWCKARLPLLYNYIQSRYWYVGTFSIFLNSHLPLQH